MHKVTYYSDRPLEKFARCRCGFVTKRHKNMDDVEDEVARHEANVNRARLQLGTRTPSLKSQRDYFRMMAENPNVDPHERRQWGILADELDTRIDDAVTTDNHPSLF
jgi:hypothetical protein